MGIFIIILLSPIIGALLVFGGYFGLIFTINFGWWLEEKIKKQKEVNNG